MKTILIFVSTLDGKVTKWGEPHVSCGHLIRIRIIIKRYGMNHDLLLWEATRLMLIHLSPPQIIRLLL